MKTTLRTLAALLALSTAALAQDGGKLSWKGRTDDPKAAMADAKRAGQTMMLFFSSVG
jgi:hypothetical protein